MSERSLLPTKEMALALFHVGAVEVGDSPHAFAMANSTGRTGIRWNVENVLGHPYAKNKVIDAFASCVRDCMVGANYQADRLVGVPDGMTTLTSSVADRCGLGQLTIKKAEVLAGNPKLSGDVIYTPTESQQLVVLEDVITTGESTRKVVTAIQEQDHQVEDIVALIGRTRYGGQILSDLTNVRVNELYTSVDLGLALLQEGKITDEQYSWIIMDYGKSVTFR